MANVLQELAQEDEALDRDHVVKRIRDWQGRIEALYRQIAAWLPDLSAATEGSVPMHEPLMREYGVGGTDLPVLTLSERGRVVARLVPNGLWIIGANGRLDLVAGDERFLIVDGADNFDPPRWSIAPSRDRRRTEPLSGDTLRRAIA